MSSPTIGTRSIVAHVGTRCAAHAKTCTRAVDRRRTRPRTVDRNPRVVVWDACAYVTGIGYATGTTRPVSGVCRAAIAPSRALRRGVHALPLVRGRSFLGASSRNYEGAASHALTCATRHGRAWVRNVRFGSGCRARGTARRRVVTSTRSGRAVHRRRDGGGVATRPRRGNRVRGRRSRVRSREGRGCGGNDGGSFHVGTLSPTVPKILTSAPPPSRSRSQRLTTCACLRVRRRVIDCACRETTDDRRLLYRRLL